MPREQAMAEERDCVQCGSSFEVNRATRDTHRYCAKDACQGERRRLAQQARRERKRAEAVTPRLLPTKAWLRKRATYMQKYRQSHRAYREQERARQSQRRHDARVAAGVVTEAGQSTHEAARVYLVTDAKSEVRLHVVTATGRIVTVNAEAASEAGCRARSTLDRSRAEGDVVTEAGRSRPVVASYGSERS